MRTTLNDGSRRHQGDLCFLAKFVDIQSTAVAHRGLYLQKRAFNSLFKRSGIRNIGINALNKRETTLVAAKIVALPITCASRTFTPIFFHIGAVNVHAVRRTLIKTCKIATQHHEIGTHRKGKSHVVVIHNTAVGANGNIDACFLKVRITCTGYVNNRGSLAATDALLLSRNADGASADADLDKVSACICKEPESFCIDNVSCSYFD